MISCIAVLADVEPSTTAAGASMVACAMAAISSLFAWLSRRDQLITDKEMTKDKLAHDTRVIQQSVEIDALRKQHAECEKNHAELKSEVLNLRKRIDDLNDRLQTVQKSV